MARVISRIAFGLLVPVLLPSASLAAAALEKTHVNIVVAGSISQMNKVPYALALNNKFFEQEGLTVTSTAFASGTAALQALVAGGADVSEAAYEHTLRLQPKGVDLTCLATFGRYPGNVLVVRRSEAGRIKTVADLKGKKIGVSAPHASTHNFVAQLLERAGVRWQDASYIAVGTGQTAVAAMRNGELDALVNLDPAITELVDGGIASILVDSRTAAGSEAAFGGPYLADCLMARASFVKENPHTAQAIANAIVHAMQWMKASSVDQIMAALPAAYYKGSENLYRRSIEQNLSAFTWDGIVTHDAAANVLKSVSVLDPAMRMAKIDLSRTYDDALVKTALKKYGHPAY